MAKKKTTKKLTAKKKATSASKKTEKGGDPGKKNDVARRRPDGTFIDGNHPSAWKPGQSGNPKGRPPTKLLSTAYKRVLGTTCHKAELVEMVGLDPEEEWSWADVIAIGLATAAVVGKTTAAKEIREATEGSTLAIKPDWEGVLRDLGVEPEDAKNDLINALDELVKKGE